MIYLYRQRFADNEAFVTMRTYLPYRSCAYIMERDLKNGEALRNMIIWADTCSGRQERWMKAQIGMEKGYRIAGHRISASYSAAKLLWIPCICCLPSWLLKDITKEAVINFYGYWNALLDPKAVLMCHI